MNGVLGITLLLPLIGILALLSPRLRRPALILSPLPLIVCAVAEAEIAVFPRSLLGSSFAIDELNRPLLLLAGIGWCVSGWCAGALVHHRRGSFSLLWLLTLAGQVTALLSADLATFYLGYVLMTVASYGLVVHERTAAAYHAGRVYMALALFGEALILTGLLSLGFQYGNLHFAGFASQPQPGAASVLLVVGFAVKLGIVPLHFWLPLAHPVAPAPASAVLSGVLVKAGLLGMMRFVPAHSLGPIELWLGLGLFSAAYGVVLGLLQSRLKTTLAYSTISQMGLAFMGFAAVQAGAAAPAALGLFVLHHGLNKISLFLAAGHRGSHRAGQLWFLLSAAALAGLPLTSGMLAKTALKSALGKVDADAWLLGLSLSSALTTTLLLHAFNLARAQTKGRDTPHPAWVVSSLAGLLVPWAWLSWHQVSVKLSVVTVLDALWPALLGAVVYGALKRPLAHSPHKVPDGDILFVVERAAARAWSMRRYFPRRFRMLRPPHLERLLTAERIKGVELAFSRTSVLGLLLLSLLLGLWLSKF